MRGDFAKSVELFERTLPGVVLTPGGREHGLLYVGACYSLGDRFAKSLETLETARVGLERRGILSYLVEHHFLLAQVHFFTGKWDDALAEIAAWKEMAAETGVSGVANILPDSTPLIHLFRGDVGEANQAFATIETDATVGSAMLANWREPIRAIMQDAGGDLDAAHATLRSWRRMLTEMEFVPDFRTVGLQIVRISQAVGDDELTQQIRILATKANNRADGVKSVEGAALLVQGAITNDAELLEAAVGACRAGGRPFDIAQACAEAGRTLLQRGDRDAGRALVMEAFERYEQLGARGSAAALAREVREFGIRRGTRRPRVADDHGWGSLTESEQRVVALVAEGLTNGEIGARLYISKGTVATHLRSVFRKVGVTSRSELAGQATRRLT